MRNRAQVRAERNAEGGYVLLALLVGASIILVMLARQLPRDAMSAQRIREQKLIDRGEEYSRAIQLYFREQNKYPRTLRDLERTDGRSYLRRRYDDPIGGDGEWRIIKMGPDGRFKDSLLYDTEEEDGFGGSRRRRNSAPASSSYIPMGDFRGGDRARMLRESEAPENPLEDQGPYNAAFNGGEQPQLDQDGNPVDQTTLQRGDFSQVRPGEVPINAGQAQTGQPPIPGFPGMPGQPSANPNQRRNSGIQPARGGIGSRGRNRGPFGGFGAGRSAAQQAGMQQQQAIPSTGAALGAAGNQASELISRLLTTPRPGGLAGLRGGRGQSQKPMQQNGPMFEEGIAGVASKADEVGVKIYKGQNNYKLWEFVYDYRQDQGGMGVGQAGPAGATGGMAAGQPGTSQAPGLGGFPAGAVQPTPGMAPPQDLIRTPSRDPQQAQTNQPTANDPGPMVVPPDENRIPFPTTMPNRTPGPNTPTSPPGNIALPAGQPQQQNSGGRMRRTRPIGRRGGLTPNSPNQPNQQ